MRRRCRFLDLLLLVAYSSSKYSDHKLVIMRLNLRGQKQLNS